MPTPQVTNPAALFTNAAPVGKKAETSSPAQSFGQVLSREMADRQQVNQPSKLETAPAPARPTHQASNSANASSPPGSGGSSAQQTATRSVTGESKHLNKNKVSAEKTTSSEDIVETKETEGQLPSDLITMVAELVQVSSTAADSAFVETVTQETQSMIDPAMILAASGMLPADQVVIRPDMIDTTADSGVDITDHLATTDLQFAAKSLGTDADKNGVLLKDTILDQGFNPRSEANEHSTSNDLATLVAKGQELMLSADSKSSSSDFSVKLQDTLTQGPSANQAVPQIMQMHAAARTPETKSADRLAPAVGSPGWDQALSQKVVWMVAGEQQTASLTLNPPDLGPLQIVLNVNNSQASATFTAAQPEVRQALEAALPKLRDMLGEAGIQLGQATVNSGSPNQQSQQDQSFSARRGGQGNQRDSGDGSGIATAQTGSVSVSSSGIGMVDTFV